VQKVFPYDLKLSHRRMDKQTDGETDSRTTTMPVARPLRKLYIFHFLKARKHIYDLWISDGSFSAKTGVVPYGDKCIDRI